MKMKMKILFGMLLLIVFINSCKKEKDDFNSLSTSNNIGIENTILIPNQSVMLKSLSIWVASNDTKRWLVNRVGNNGRSNDKLGEILVLEILSSDLANSFVEYYNSINNESYTISGLSNFISNNNKMLAIKFESYFDDYLLDIDNYTPIVSNLERTEHYKDGDSFDAKNVIEINQGALIIGFVLVEAKSTVLYDPVSKSFNRSLPYNFCDEDLFTNHISEFRDPISTGEIPLNIIKDVQRIFYENCFNFTGVLTPEICNNGIDDDGDGLIDCADPDCCDYCSNCVEICNNGIDDDGDGLIDGLDPDCINNSICMRDHYLEENVLHELEMQTPFALTGMGINPCEGFSISNDPFSVGASQVANGQNLYPSSFIGMFLEEHYAFLINFHWVNSNGQSEIKPYFYDINIWELVNAPIFTIGYYSAGTSGTGGGGGVAILYLEQQGMTSTLPVSLLDLPFFDASDICGINNWNPGEYGDKVGISINEVDFCVTTSSGSTTTSTTTSNTYNAVNTVNFGTTFNIGGTPFTGGYLNNSSNSNTNTTTTTVTTSYTK